MHAMVSLTSKTINVVASLVSTADASGKRVEESLSTTCIDCHSW